MSSALAIIPARSGSKGIPNKNTCRFNDHGPSPLMLAVDCARRAGIAECWVTTDGKVAAGQAGDSCYAGVIARPPDLAQDDTPMIAVVQHVLEQIPGPPDQQVVLLQPTQPLREVKHIQQALALLTLEVDSVVSVVKLHLAQSPEWLTVIDAHGRLWPWHADEREWAMVPGRRQDVLPAYQRDGTVYAFWRQTVSEHGNIYGQVCVPLIIPPEETCPLDTMLDWAEAERRLREREESVSR